MSSVLSVERRDSLSGPCSHRMGSRVTLSSLFCPCCLFSCLLWQFQRGGESREHSVSRMKKCSVHQITVFMSLYPELPVKHC